MSDIVRVADLALIAERTRAVALRGGLTEAGSMRLLLQHPLHMRVKEALDAKARDRH
jgi:hypothetical protein